MTRCQPPPGWPIPAFARCIAWKTAGRHGWTSRPRWRGHRRNLASFPPPPPTPSPAPLGWTSMDRARIDEGFARTGHTIVPLVWELSRIVGEPHGGWVHWGATTQNITQTGDLLVLRQAHGDLPAPDRRDPVGDGRSRGTRRRDADCRPHPWPARCAGHLRLQGRGLDRRIDPPCRAVASGRAAAVCRHAGRRGRDLRLAWQERAAGAAGRSAGCWALAP